MAPSAEAKEQVRKIGDPYQQRETGPGRDIMEIVVNRAKTCLKEKGLVEGYEGDVIGAGELWRC
jgi:hypothetical protein